MNLQVNCDTLLPRANETVHVVQAPSKIGLSDKEIWTKYANVFQGLGELGEPLHLVVDVTIKPVQIPLRQILKALSKPLKDHLVGLKQQVHVGLCKPLTGWVP